MAYDFPRAVSHPEAPGWLLMFSGGWTPSCNCFFRAKPACSTHQPLSYTEAPSCKSHLEILTLQCQALPHSKPDDFLAPHGSLVAHFQLCCCTRWKLLFDLLYLHIRLPFGKHLEVPIRLNNGDNLRLVGFTFTVLSSFPIL